MAPLATYLILLCLGTMVHFNRGWRTADPDEDFFWLWSQPVRSKTELYARYSFIAFVITSLVVFFPVDQSIGLVIPCLFLASNLILMTFRQQ